MKEIVKALCEIWNPSWQGLVIGKLVYTKGNRSTGPYEWKLREGKAVKVEIRNAAGESIEMTLLPFKGKKNSSPIERKGRFLHTFSKEEVHAFSKNLGDHNEIHLNDHPIVSGFQLLSLLMNEIEGRVYQISFYAPLYSGEDFYIEEKGKVILGYGVTLCLKLEVK